MRSCKQLQRIARARGIDRSRDEVIARQSLVVELGVRGRSSRRAGGARPRAMSWSIAAATRRAPRVPAVAGHRDRERDLRGVVDRARARRRSALPRCACARLGVALPVGEQIVDPAVGERGDRSGRRSRASRCRACSVRRGMPRGVVAVTRAADGAPSRDVRMARAVHRRRASASVSAPVRRGFAWTRRAQDLEHRCRLLSS